MANGKVLLIDDEPFILNATADLLRSSGYIVATCEQWAGIARTVRLESPDVILLDYNMPSIKGDEVCAALKRNDVNPGMKIFIFSSEPEEDLVGIVERSGADGYIRKGTAGHQLLRRVREILEPSTAA